MNPSVYPNREIAATLRRERERDRVGKEKINGRERGQNNRWYSKV